MDTDYAIRIVESSDSFETFIAEADVSNELREQLSMANVLVVPLPKYRDFEGPYFPKYTDEFFHFLRENAPDNLVVEICIEDENFQILELRDDTLDIAHFIVNEIAAPLIVDLVVLYVGYKLGSRLTRTDVRAKVTVQDSISGKSASVEYDGPASEYDSTVGETIRQISVTDYPDSFRELDHMKYEERVRRLSERKGAHGDWFAE